MPSTGKVRTSHRVLLCIDDDEAQVLMQRELLNAKGYDVVIATGGMDGLAAFGNFHVDLVVVDYKMPDIDGAAVARQLRQKNPSTPIVMFTGVDEIPSADIESVDVVVRKGESPTALSDKIEAMLSYSGAHLFRTK
jgi:CheY-like chemotaxis protein